MAFPLLLLHFAKPITCIVKPLTDIINLSISTSTFPDRLKEAQVAPIPFLAAFRSGFGCQSTLLRVIEDWKLALDKNEYLAAILMDLSKAFDCLPHDLLLLKLNPYGLSKSSLDLLCSYLTKRKQCVKLNQNLSNMFPIFCHMDCCL